MKTLTEHNEDAQAEHDKPKPAGVICPVCDQGGDAVEMLLVNGLRLSAGCDTLPVTAVYCPKCNDRSIMLVPNE